MPTRSYISVPVLRQGGTVDHFVRMSLEGIGSGDVGVFMRTDVILIHASEEEENDNSRQQQNSQGSKSSLLRLTEKAYCCMQ